MTEWEERMKSYGANLIFDARVRHKVIAVVKSKILVTIGASLS